MRPVYQVLLEDALNGDRGLTVKELAAATGRPEHAVRRDLNQDNLGRFAPVSRDYPMMCTGVRRVGVWSLSRKALVELLKEKR